METVDRVHVLISVKRVEISSVEKTGIPAVPVNNVTGCTGPPGLTQ